MNPYGMEQYRLVVDLFPPGSMEAIESIFVMIQEYSWRHPTFKSELTSVKMSDPLFSEGFQQTDHSLLGLVRQAIEDSVAKGIMKPLAERERALLTEEVWLVTLFWQNYLEVWDVAVNEETLRRGLDLLRNIFRPYLAE